MDYSVGAKLELNLVGAGGRVGSINRICTPLLPGAREFARIHIVLGLHSARHHTEEQNEREKEKQKL